MLGIIRGAAADLMPYHHAKKPQQLELPAGDKRPMMVFGNVEQMQIVAGDGFMSAGIMPGEKPDEINGNAVRLDDSQSHENAKPLNSDDKAGSND
ncbi:hypothetical protein NKH24_29505 [Mesorhizobium sp. M1300]|uniref:hypothetical protein n=1 Tax=Mesorhizobium sp. M1300 TaxID=2957077 RepID=UPI003339C585